MSEEKTRKQLPGLLTPEQVEYIERYIDEGGGCGPNLLQLDVYAPSRFSQLRLPGLLDIDQIAYINWHIEVFGIDPNLSYQLAREAEAEALEVEKLNRQANRRKRKSVTHFLHQIIKRDGGEWKCYYCGRPLVPPDTPKDKPPHYCEMHGSYWIEKTEGEMVKVEVTAWTRVDRDADPHVDHKIPVCKGGSNDLDNLVVACARCNLRKHDKTDAEWIEILSRQGVCCE